MELQISDFARLAGVSVRTLRYYDEIGLLCPSRVDEKTGYRFYEGDALLRMQEILFYRELDVPLKRIAQLLTSPSYNRQAVLREQKMLLTLKKERLERLISAIDSAAEGENVMKAFDNSQFEAYKAEAQQRWGDTDAYRQHAEKTKSYGKDKWQAMAGEMDAIMGEFAACMRSGADAAGEEARSLVRKLQNHICENYYHCTDEILMGLGQMYVCDERFQNNIDAHGEGTAAFVSRAIAACCKRN